MGFWNAEREAEAERLYIVEGRSASETAKAVGAASRNAIIGVAHRRGWMKDHRQKPSSTGKARAQAAAPARAVTPKPARQFGIAGNGMVFDRGEARPPQVVVNYPEEPAGSVTILTAKAHHCRWPIGEGAGLTFCGKPRRDETVSYCPDHCRVAFQTRFANGRPIPNTRELERSLRRFTA